MSESKKFTPGPWNNMPKTEYVPICKQDEVGLALGFINSTNLERTAEGKANAYLIAAAPDLLEALENLLWHAEVLEEFIESERGRGRNADQLYADGEMHNYMVEAKASILKARGQQ